MSEPIMRMIAELRDRIASLKRRLEYLREEEKILRAEYARALEAYRKAKPEEVPIALREVNRVRKELSTTWGAIGGTTREIGRLTKRLEELERTIPPYKYVRWSITFSIETGRGHEPFFAEVTCDTVVEKEVTIGEIRSRLLNAVVKLFWFLFDVQKTLYDLELAGYKGTPNYNFIVKRKEFIQKHAVIPKKVREAYMDGVFHKLKALDKESRKRGYVIFPRADPEEYVTAQAIIKIGVEPPLPVPEDAEPKYPLVHLLIEKSRRRGEPPTWTVERLLAIAKHTDIDMLGLLGMTLG